MITKNYKANDSFELQEYYRGDIQINMRKKFSLIIVLLFFFTFSACNYYIDSEYDCEERIYAALMRLDEILQNPNENEDANMYSLGIVYTAILAGEKCYRELEQAENDPRYKEFWRSQRERLSFD